MNSPHPPRHALPLSCPARGHVLVAGNTVVSASAGGENTGTITTGAPIPDVSARRRVNVSCLLSLPLSPSLSSLILVACLSLVSRLSLFFFLLSLVSFLVSHFYRRWSTSSYRHRFLANPFYNAFFTHFPTVIHIRSKFNHQAHRGRNTLYIFPPTATMPHQPPIKVSGHAHQLVGRQRCRRGMELSVSSRSGFVIQVVSG